MTSPERAPAKRNWRDDARDQGLVLARRQALAGGMTSRAWDYRVEHAGWQLPLPGVAVLHTGPLTDAELRWVAVLHGGPGARLTGDGALAAYGLKRLQVERLHVAVGPRRQLAVATTTSGTVVDPRRVAVPETWFDERHGLPLLSVHVAVLHAAAWAPSDRAAELRLVVSVQQRLTAVPRLRSALAAIPKLPRRSLVRTVLDDVELGAHALSELDFLRFCRRHGLPEPDDLQVRVRAGGTRYLDGRYRRQRTSLEIDGAGHLWAETWSADTLRSLELAVVAEPGERLVRLTQFNLRHDEARVAVLLRALLL